MAVSYIHEFIGHHTCSAQNGQEYVRIHAPFWAEFDQENGKLQFLGSGYYFWDDNEDMAHHWGRVHYKGEYCILEAEMKAPNHLLLDLVGSRKIMKFVESKRSFTFLDPRIIICLIDKKSGLLKRKQLLQ